MTNSIKIKAMVDGVEREVELNFWQISKAHDAIQKAYDIEDIENYLEDWFPDEFGEYENYDALLKRAHASKEMIATKYRRIIDNSDDWFYSLRDMMSDTVKEWASEVETESVEVCPHCSNECVYENCDPTATNYVKRCSHCGAEIMLCDECQHAEDNPNRFCDWHEEIEDGKKIGVCFRGVTRN